MLRKSEVPGWVKQVMKDYSDQVCELKNRISILEAENERLRNSKENVISALESIEEDEHGNVIPYRYDSIISRIRNAVTEDPGYQMPWVREGSV